MNTVPVAVLIGIDTGSNQSISADDSLCELVDLSITAGIQVSSILIQKRTSADNRSYLGKGKLDELRLRIEASSATLIVTDDELTPTQYRFLESFFSLKVIDRTGLILDIFAQRAFTHEAKLQVELAQLTYLYPRLTRLWTHLSRLGGGGVGTRGPGEKQLEVDKRLIRKRIVALKKDIKAVALHRNRHRHSRKRLPLLTGALIGYTNAGKSTLFNALTGASVLEEDRLFATLDPTTRTISFPHKADILLTDTVGFIQKLPHHLVDAFKATMEEIIVADFLIHVVDSSNPNIDHVINTSTSVLSDIGFTPKPTLYVFNKKDLVNSSFDVCSQYTPYCFVSALNLSDISDLKETIASFITQFETIMSFSIPYSRSDILNKLYKFGSIISKNYGDVIHVTASINPIIGSKLLSELYEKN